MTHQVHQVGSVGAVKNPFRTPWEILCNDLLEGLPRIDGERIDWDEDLRRLFESYTAAKQRQNVLDYDDLLLYWARK